MNRVELLSPAGSMEALKAAVCFGADAVYLGGKFHNARINAKNFNDDELEAAIKYGRIRGKKVYITLNTLFFEKELDGLIKYVNMLGDMGANAVIVQDFGIAKVLLEETEMPLHASTQMGIHNLEGCRFLENRGFSRAILSRETPLNEIKRIFKGCNLEIETFIHGALCSGFSGQCLYSFLKGGRSGNRGECAQPCRLKYNGAKSDYPLSTKDLMTLELLPELIFSGISSFKIEGRMKRPAYVGVVTDVYRRAIDCVYEKGCIDTEKLKHELVKIYNRGGFTKGYYSSSSKIFGNDRPNHIGEKVGKVIKRDRTKITIETDREINVYDGLSFGKCGMEISDLYLDGKRVQRGKGRVSFSCVLKDVSVGDDVYRTTDVKQISMVNEKIASEQFKISVNAVCRIDDYVNIALSAKDRTVTAKGDVKCSEALSRPVLEEDVEKAVKKLGNTEFELNNIEIFIKEGVYVPLKEINNVRRKAVDLLEQQLIKSERRGKAEKLAVEIPDTDNNIKVAIGYEGDSRPKCDVFLVYPKIGNHRHPDIDGYVLPPICFQKDFEILKEVIKQDDILLCNNVSQIEYFKGTCRIWAGSGMNCTNVPCRDFLYSLGCEQIISSIEANVPRTLCIQKGMIPVMTFVRCPVKEDVGCGNCDTFIDGSGKRLHFKCSKIHGTYAFLNTYYQRDFGQVEYI